MSVTVTTGIFNSDIDKLNGNTVDVSSGNKSTGTLRVAVATDDINLAAIKTAVEKIDDVQDAVGTPGSAIPTKGLIVQGSDGTNARDIKTDTGGNLTVVRVALTNTWTQLTAPGSTAAFATPGKTDHTVAVTVAAINTNVVVRVEGSLDNTNWFNLDASETDTTISSNSTRGFKFTGALAYIRTTFVSESGGTAATIDAKYLGQ